MNNRYQYRFPPPLPPPQIGQLPPSMQPPAGFTPGQIHPTGLQLGGGQFSNVSVWPTTPNPVQHKFKKQISLFSFLGNTQHQQFWNICLFLNIDNKFFFTFQAMPYGAQFPPTTGNNNNNLSAVFGSHTANGNNNNIHGFSGPTPPITQLGFAQHGPVPPGNPGYLANLPSSGGSITGNANPPLEFGPDGLTTQGYLMLPWFISSTGYIP